VVDVQLSTATVWETISFPIPAAHIGRSYAVRLEIDGGGDGVESVVDVDDLHFIPEPGSPLLLASGIAGLLLLGRKRAKGSK
jgi:hypothetical protein